MNNKVIEEFISKTTDMIMERLRKLGKRQDLNEMARVGFLDNRAKYEV
jgi:hypothetical protein